MGVLREVFWMGVGAALMGAVLALAWLVGWVLDWWQRRRIRREIERLRQRDMEVIGRAVIREALRRKAAVVYPWPESSGRIMTPQKIAEIKRREQEQANQRAAALLEQLRNSKPSSTP